MSEPDYGPLFGCLIYAAFLCLIGTALVGVFALGVWVQSWL